MENEDVMSSLFQYFLTTYTSNIHSIWLKTTKVSDDLKGQTKNERARRKRFLKSMLGSLGVEICFVFPALGWGSGAKGKRSWGILGASSCTDLREAPALLPQYTTQWCHQGDSNVWEFTIGVFRVHKEQMHKHAGNTHRRKVRYESWQRNELWASQLCSMCLLQTLKSLRGDQEAL